MRRRGPSFHRWRASIIPLVGRRCNFFRELDFDPVDYFFPPATSAAPSWAKADAWWVSAEPFKMTSASLTSTWILDPTSRPSLRRRSETISSSFLSVIPILHPVRSGGLENGAAQRARRVRRVYRLVLPARKMHRSSSSNPKRFFGSRFSPRSARSKKQSVSRLFIFSDRGVHSTMGFRPHFDPKLTNMN